jgi:hypothetical protein
MLVKTGDFIKRDEAEYEVIIADENLFVIGDVRYDDIEGCCTTSYERLEAYSNIDSINTLEQLGFEKIQNL